MLIQKENRILKEKSELKSKETQWCDNKWPGYFMGLAREILSEG
jgi:hypothetical protein